MTEHNTTATLPAIAGERTEVPVRQVQFSAIDTSPAAPSASGAMDMLMDVSLRVSVVLGRAQMLVKDVLALQHGSVVELDHMAGEPVDVLVNDRLIARGEVVVIEDKFGIRITEIVSPTARPPQDE
ncbi:MAG: flagellar motor switch protein FliN [Chloroflexi bacterium]|nr:flagellar motor switch protein FliN [Chloroflexota bacterium]